MWLLLLIPQGTTTIKLDELNSVTFPLKLCDPTAKDPPPPAYWQMVQEAKPKHREYGLWWVAEEEKRDDVVDDLG